MIKVLNSGFYTSIQDNGRYGYRHLGVPVSGAMDHYSFTLANRLLGNSESDAVLEMALLGGAFEFGVPTYIALTGAEIAGNLNETSIAINQVYKVNKGDRLTIKGLRSGVRAYLAVKGGIQTEEVLGSRSFYHPITEQKALKVGDEILIAQCDHYESGILSISPSNFQKVSELEVYPGPEFHMLTEGQKQQLKTGKFKVAKENDRMAYQLDETLDPHEIQMLTSATLPGTVQLTPSGKLIILMRDGQTTGGYPRILQLSTTSIAVLAQKKQGDALHFKFKEVG